MRYLETHQIFRYRDLTFRPAHALISISAGPRCRVCARLHHDPSAGVLCGGHLCSTYRPGDAAFAALVRNLCVLQDHFKIWCEQNLNRTWVPVAGLRGSGPWWWAMMHILFSQCERSLAHIGPSLTGTLARGWSHGTSCCDQLAHVTDQVSSTGRLSPRSQRVQVRNDSLPRIHALRVRHQAGRQQLVGV